MLGSASFLATVYIEICLGKSEKKIHVSYITNPHHFWDLQALLDPDLNNS